MTFPIKPRDLEKLKGVHPDLVAVVHRAFTLSTINFCVTEGLRTIEKQKQLMAIGATRTMNSRHLTGHAVDLAAWVDDGDGKIENGEIRWDWPLYSKIAMAMKLSAKELNIPLEWGGDWASFRDGPHFQLPFKDYPA